MAKQKEFDFVTTFRTTDGIKKKKLQSILEASLAEILESENFENEFIDTAGKVAVSVTSVTFSDIRKVNEDGTVEGVDTPEEVNATPEQDNELLTALDALGFDLDGVSAPQNTASPTGPNTVAW